MPERDDQAWMLTVGLPEISGGEARQTILGTKPGAPKERRHAAWGLLYCQHGRTLPEALRPTPLF